MNQDLWKDQYGLNEQKAKDLLLDAFPELSISSISHIGSGWDFTSFEVNSELIFRFPKRDEYNNLYKTEVDVMKIIGPSISVATPNYSYISQSCYNFPNLIGGYRKILGISLLDVPLDKYTTKENARIIGKFLTTLHSRSTFEKVESLPIYREKPRPPSILQEKIRENLMNLKDKVSPDVWVKFDSLFNNCVVPPIFNGEPVLIHNDLGLEHIICSEEDYTISGVIDWTDMVIGDPTSDLACIWASNKVFYQMIMDYYSGTVDKNFQKRVEQKGIYTLLGDSLYGYMANDKRRMAWGNKVLKSNFLL